MPELTMLKLRLSRDLPHKECLVFPRMRLWMVGFIAVLIGMPLSEKAFGQVGSLVGWIVDASVQGSDGDSD